MTSINDHPTELSGTLGADDLVQLIDRFPVAVSVLGPDGRTACASGLAREIFGLVAADSKPPAMDEIDWPLLDTDGKALAPDRLPPEITRLTGEQVDNAEVGLPGADGETVWLRLSTRRLTDVGPPYAVVCSLTDVTAERNALSEIGVMSQMLTRAFDSAPIGIALVGVDGRWLRVNRSLCDLLGLSEGELLATTFQDLTHPDDLGADLALLQETLAGKRSSYSLKKRYLRSDGSHIWADLSVALVHDHAGEPLHFISQIQDVTERHQLEERLRRLADRDHLTGLLNRRRFEEELDRQLGLCARNDDRAALLLLDIDCFKQVNDTRGHAAGDQLLQAVADICRRRTRGTDLVARLGGDEFAAILVDTDAAGASGVAEALLDAIRQLDAPAATASIGLTLMRPEDRPDALLARADRALYAVKRGGRDGVRFDA